MVVEMTVEVMMEAVAMMVEESRCYEPAEVYEVM